jgi:PAS domain S-box-containing protein
MGEIKKYNVLYIEDDQVDQMAFKRLMKDNEAICGYVIAGSIAESKQVLASQKFDVIVTDYNLGDGTAMDVVSEVRDIPVIFITRLGGEDAAIKALKYGAYDYMVKDPDRRYLQMMMLTMVRAMRRKKAEIQSRLLGEVARLTSDSVYIADREDWIVFANESFLKTYGYTQEEVLREKSLALWGAADVKHFTTGVIAEKSEVHHKRKNGEEFPVECLRSAVKDENGHDLAVVYITRSPK